MTQSYAGLLNTFSVGGSSQLEFLENANLTFEDVHEEGAPASRFGGNAQGVKRRGTVSASLFSDSSTAIRVSHLGLSAAALGSVDLLDPNILARLTFGVEYEHKLSPGAGLLWELPVVADGRLSASLELAHDSTEAPALLIALGSGTYGDLNLTLDFTLGGVQIQAPFRLAQGTLPIEKSGLMTYTLTLADRSARSGVTVLPSGTTSLLEKALNAPRTAIAFAFKGKAHPTIEASGNMVYKSMNLEIRDGGLVPVQYEWATQGAVTIAASAS